MDAREKYKEKWLKISYDTNKANRKLSEKFVNEVYKASKNKPPLMFFWADDPIMSALQIIAMFFLEGNIYNKSHIKAKVPKLLFDSYSSFEKSKKSRQILTSYVNSFTKQIANLYLSLYVGEDYKLCFKDKFTNECHPDLSINQFILDFATNKKVTHSFISSEIKEKILYMSNGAQDGSWLGIYDQNIRESLCLSDSIESTFEYKGCDGIGNIQELIFPLIELSKYCGWWSAFEKFAFLQEKPKKYCLDGEKLHCEDGPAIKFRGELGLEIYYLNGDRVPGFIVNSKAEDLDVNLIFKDRFPGFFNSNEIRNEIIKKIGANKIMERLNAEIIDEKTGEELWRSYPIGEYVQQGDQLSMNAEILGFKDVTSNGKFATIPIYKEVIINKGRTFDELPPDMKIRLRQGVWYKLYKATYKINNANIQFKALRMGNPSVDGEEHIEFVHESCDNVFEAYIFRNFRSSKEFDWRELLTSGKACLPKNLS